MFGPKVLAGRNNFPDPALESRCLRIYMQSGMPHRHIPVELPTPFRSEVDRLQNKLLAWRLDNYHRQFQEPERLPIESRLMQLYLPLASVVADDEAAGEVLRNAVLALQAEMTESRSASPEGQVLTALMLKSEELVLKEAPPFRIQLVDISTLTALDGGRSLSPRQVKTICKTLGVAAGPKTNRGATVLFDPSACQEVLRQYGLVPEEESLAA